MKEAVTVSIKTPCTENWDSFTPTQQGGFCERCNKTVVDLTKMNERELLEFLRSRTSGTCARLRKDQLGLHQLPTPARVVPGLGLFKAAAATLIFAMVSRQVYSQDKVANRIDGIEASVKTTNTDQARHEKLVNVSGKVVDDFGVPMPGVSIVLQGTPQGTTSDTEGKFSFPEPVQEGQTLLFSFIGYVTQEYKVRGYMSDAIEISIEMEGWALTGELLTDQPYTVDSHKSLWTKIRRLF